MSAPVMSTRGAAPASSRKAPLAFFLIAFGMPWIGWSIIAFAGEGLSRTQRTMLFYTGDFCSIAGIVATYIEQGRPGLGRFWARCCELRAEPWVWAFIALIPMTVALAAVYAWQLRPNHVLGGASFLAFFATPGLWRSILSGPLGEELGWRGYLQPRLMRRFTPLTTSMIVGVIWGIWHYPLYVHSIFSTVSGAAGFTLTTVCYSIIITAVYNHSRGSILVAVLFHWFINTLPNGVFHVFGTVHWQLVANEMIYGYCIVTALVLIMLGPSLRRSSTPPVVA